MTRFTFSSMRFPPVLPLDSVTYPTEAACVSAAREECDSDFSSQFVFRHDGVGARWTFVCEVQPTPAGEAVRP